MVHYISSIITAHMIIGMLQQEQSLQEHNVRVTVFHRSSSQQGFILRGISQLGIEQDVDYSITEDQYTNEIVIFKRVEIDNPGEGETIHSFDRDFDAAVRYLVKEFKREFSKE